MAELENFKQSSFSCLALFVKIMFPIIFVKNCSIIHQCLITKSFARMAVIMSLIQYTLTFYISRILWRFSYGVGSYSHTIEQTIALPCQKVKSLRDVFRVPVRLTLFSYLKDRKQSKLISLLIRKKPIMKILSGSKDEDLIGILLN